MPSKKIKTHTPIKNSLEKDISHGVSKIEEKIDIAKSSLEAFGTEVKRIVIVVKKEVTRGKKA